MRPPLAKSFLKHIIHKMNNEIKIIFVDIDWTLIDHSFKPFKYDKKSIKALKKAQKLGIKVFINTARPYHSVKQIKLFDLIKPDGMILSNGGVVIYNNEVLYTSDIKEEYFESICKTAIKNNLNLEGVRVYDCFMIKELDDATKALFATYPEDIPPVEDYHHQKVIGINLFASKEYDEKFIKILPKDYVYFRYHDFGVDIAPSPHDKGEAIKIVLDKLNISKDHALAIGDDIVDISMFNNVKYGIAMGNAKEEVKIEASHITSHVNKHGVKKALKEIVFK